MADENSRLNVEIRQTAKGTGIQDTTRDLKGMTSAAGEAAQATGAAGRSGARGIAALGETVEKGAAAGRGLADVFSGNVGGVGAILKALAAFMSGPFGVAIAGVGVLAAIAGDKFVDAYSKKKKSIEDTKKSVDEAKQSIEELGKQRLDALRANLDAVSEAADRMRRDFEDDLAAAEKLADVQDRLAETRIKNDTTISEAERARRLAAIAEGAAERRSKGVVDRAENVAAAKVAPRDAAQGAETAAAQIYSQLTATLENIRAARKAAEEEVARIVADRNARFAEIERTMPEGMARQGAMREAAEAAQQEAAPSVARLEFLNSDAGRANEAALEAQLKAAQEQLDAANKAALKSAEELAAAERRLARVREEQLKLSQAEAVARNAETFAALGGAWKKDDATAAAAVESTGAAAAAAQMAEKMRGMPGYKVGETADFRAAAEALSKAAEAAKEGGATAAEANALLQAMRDVAAAFAIRDLRSAELDRQIKTLGTQIQTLRTR